MADLLSTLLGLAGLEKMEIKEIPLRDILKNPHQPREIFEEKALRELSQSISEVGIIQPIVVRRRGAKYELIVGERRIRASRQAGLTKIPAVIRQLSEDERLELTLIENLQRSDLTPLEEAGVYLKLIRDLKLTQLQVAQKVGKSPHLVSNMLRLLRLPPKVKDDVSRETISKGHAFALLRLKDEGIQLRVLSEIKKRSLSVRQTEDLVERRRRQPHTVEKGKTQTNEETKKQEKTAHHLLSLKELVKKIRLEGIKIRMRRLVRKDYIELRIRIPKDPCGVNPK